MRTVFILISFWFASCTKNQDVSASSVSGPTPPPAPTVQDTAKLFLALGDSYTIGQSVSEPERFPAQVRATLQQSGVNLAVPVYIAQTGWTTSNLLSAIAAQNPKPVYDVVTLLIGVNDQYQHLDTAGYATHFQQLLEQAVYLAKGNRNHVFVLSIPDYSATPFVAQSDKARVSMEIDWFNAINKRITGMFQISYTDITPASRLASTNASLITYDGLHPSGSQYKLWTDLLAPKIKAVF